MRQVLNETLRISCIRAYAVRAVDNDTTIGGFEIPAHVCINYNISIVVTYQPGLRIIKQWPVHNIPIGFLRFPKIYFG